MRKEKAAKDAPLTAACDAGVRNFRRFVMYKHVLYTALIITFISTDAIAASEQFFINLDSRINVNSSSAVTLQLDEGKYTVTPLNKEQGGIYTAANRFQKVTECDVDGNNCENGWDHYYSIRIGTNKLLQYGCATGVGPLDCGGYFSSESEAFQNSVSSEFTLSEPTIVKFFWPDNNPIDNEGGISLVVQKEQDAACVTTVTPDLNIHIPSLNYELSTGTLHLWADLEYYGQSSNSEFLWKLKDFGENEQLEQ